MMKSTAPDDDTPVRSKMLSVDEALELLLARARPIEEVESVALPEALGRVVARSQRSAINVPEFDNSSMDGIAICSSEASAGRVELRLSQRITAGDRAAPLAPGDAARIFTGAPLPVNADAVVMQEDCEFDAGSVRFAGPVPAGQHVRPRGNNVRQGDEVLAAGVRVRPQELGIAASVGLGELPVYRRCKVAFFSSGNELKEPGEPLAVGQIYNSNRYTLHGLVHCLGCEFVDLGIVADDLDATRAILLEASRQADVVVSSGGVSVGEEDHIKNAIEAVGRLELWNVAVKPGKPVAYGRIGAADFLGLPGNPVSTLVTFCLFARPFILRRQGAVNTTPLRVPVVAAFEWPKPMRRREFVRARVSTDEQGRLCARLFERQGSDVMSSTVWATGLVEIPERAVITPGDIVAYIDFEQLLG